MKLRQYLRARNPSRAFGHVIRVMAPTLIALTVANVAHAQGTMDFSGAQTLMGTFKTTTLAVIRHGAERNGYAVKGFAPTSRAARQLREAGINADKQKNFDSISNECSKHFAMRVSLAVAGYAIECDENSMARAASLQLPHEPTNFVVADSTSRCFTFRN